MKQKVSITPLLHNSKIKFLLIILIIQGLTTAGGFSVGKADGQTIDLILAGGVDRGQCINVDDNINVYLNGNPVFIDPSWAGCKNPIPVQAKDGDVIKIAAVDSVGGCRGIGPVYIHRTDCDVHDLIIKRRDDGCQGYPASTEPYLTATYTVNLKKLTCPDIQVTKMQCGIKVPTMVLWDERNETILPDSSDFPPEILSASARDPERVTFNVLSKPDSDTTYTVSGYAIYTPLWKKTEAAKLIYGPKDITITPDTAEVKTLFESSEIQAFDTVRKVDRVRWQVLKKGEIEPTQQEVPKVLYCVTKPPIYPLEDAMSPPSGARVEIMDMACRMANGLNVDSWIRAALENGVCNENWGRVYQQAQHFDEVLGIFHLTNFLKDYTADDCDLSIMHYLTCKALGMEIHLTRLTRIPGLNGYYGYPKESVTWLIVNGACSYLGQNFGPGVCIFNNGWHQVTAAYSPVSRIYDPMIKYNVVAMPVQGNPISYQNTGGKSERLFELLFKPKVQWKSNITGLLPILRQID